MSFGILGLDNLLQLDYDEFEVVSYNLDIDMSGHTHSITAEFCINHNVIFDIKKLSKLKSTIKTWSDIEDDVCMILHNSFIISFDYADNDLKNLYYYITMVKVVCDSVSHIQEKYEMPIEVKLKKLGL